MTTTGAVDRFTAAIESGSWGLDGVFDGGVILDATVPDWRFQVYGSAAVDAQLADWFAVAGRFEALRRVPLPDGELVEFTLTWEEHGVPHACHQAHILTMRDGRIVADTAFCGGRWPAQLLAEMAEAQRVRVG